MIGSYKLSDVTEVSYVQRRVSLPYGPVDAAHESRIVRI